MADFGYLSDTDESAVDDLITQAQELCVLEQVSKINCSDFSNSALPTDLETRFQKLKSFPLPKPKTSTPTVLSNSNIDFAKTVHGSVLDDDIKMFSPNKRDPSEKKQILLETQQNREEKFFVEKESSLNSPTMEEIYSYMGKSPDGNKGLEKKSKANSSAENFISSFGSPLGSSNSSVDPDSPPPKSGCFWCSPKRASKKKNKENCNVIWSGKNDEFLASLNSFSVKEQQKMLRKAMKEEERIDREAEKIVKWAKQASDRMNFDGIDDDSGDDEKSK
ncbi:hypothetical protein JCGZ_02752 [Jatropha curcas]|uniref:Uncharacterized protein n=1 Tax=Jatropha curcas TaxID=180498 RepID=A0A067KUF0_JATCU|nr:uncharacterized protein LOC105632656 [Jatropha curcas]KDP39732.1 hypothetical protein JCGZ_02752 [Jatropha curcas]